MNWYVTFGCRYSRDQHPRLLVAHPDGWVRIEAPDDLAARIIAFDKLGVHWAFLYSEQEFDPSFHPRGELAVFT